jgi:hypothetical protein
LAKAHGEADGKERRWWRRGTGRAASLDPPVFDPRCSSVVISVKPAILSAQIAHNIFNHFMMLLGEPGRDRTVDHLIKSRVGRVVTSDREAPLERKIAQKFIVPLDYYDQE